MKAILNTWIFLLAIIAIAAGLGGGCSLGTHMQTAFYVATNGSDSGEGTKESPLRTIQVAVNRGLSGVVDADSQTNVIDVYVQSGIYTPGNGLVNGTYGIYITKGNVHLHGGLNSDFSATNGWSDLAGAPPLKCVIAVLGNTNHVYGDPYDVLDNGGIRNVVISGFVIRDTILTSNASSVTASGNLTSNPDVTTVYFTELTNVGQNVSISVGASNVNPAISITELWFGLGAPAVSAYSKVATSGSWSSNLFLTNGSYTFSIYAVDSRGYRSSTNSNTFSIDAASGSIHVASWGSESGSGSAQQPLLTLSNGIAKAKALGISAIRVEYMTVGLAGTVVNADGLDISGGWNSNFSAVVSSGSFWNLPQILIGLSINGNGNRISGFNFWALSNGLILEGNSNLVTNCSVSSIRGTGVMIRGNDNLAVLSVGRCGWNPATEGGAFRVEGTNNLVGGSVWSNSAAFGAGVWLSGLSNRVVGGFYTNRASMDGGAVYISNGFQILDPGLVFVSNSPSNVSVSVNGSGYIGGGTNRLEALFTNISSGMVLSGPSITFAGRATPFSAALDSVLVAVDNGVFQVADGVDSWTFVTSAINNGPHVFRVFCIDADGFCSATNSISNYVFTTPAVSAVFVVPEGGDDSNDGTNRPLKTLQAAVVKANAYGVTNIRAVAGIYTNVWGLNSDTNVTNCVAISGNNLDISGGWNASFTARSGVTVLSAGWYTNIWWLYDRKRVLTITNATNLSLTGFEIAYAHGDTTGPWSSGVGLYMSNTVQCRLSNISVYSNSTDEYHNSVGISMLDSWSNSLYILAEKNTGAGLTVGGGGYHTILGTYSRNMYAGIILSNSVSNIVDVTASEHSFTDNRGNVSLLNASGNRVRATSDLGQYGIYCLGGMSNFFEVNAQNNTSYGYYESGAKANVLTSNFIGNWTGLYVNGAQGFSLTNAVFTGSSGSGIYFNASFNLFASNLSVRDNPISGGSVFGISGCSNTVVLDSQVIGNTTTGMGTIISNPIAIALSVQNSKNTVLQDGVFTNNAVTPRSGIHFSYSNYQIYYTNAQNLMLSNCRVGAVTGSGGVLLREGTEHASTISLVGNTFVTNGPAKLQVRWNGQEATPSDAWTNINDPAYTGASAESTNNSVAAD